MQYIRCTHRIPAVRMVSVEEIRRRPQRAEGPASVLAIGTATPSNCVDQSSFPDYYFRVTNSEHKAELKHKFKRMCESSLIKKRYIHLTEELLSENPSIAACMAPSLDARQAIVAAEVPRLGKEAAEKAIKEWGQPRSSITHLIFCTSTTGVDIPSADFHLTKLLGLRPSVNRLMMCQHGCYGGASALRVAKDLAENNAGARVLIVCCEVTAVFFRGPDEAHLGDLVAQAIFGDGAAAAVVGSDPVAGSERPLFEIVSGAQTIIPDSEDRIEVHVGEAGMIVELLKDVPELISGNIEGCLKSALSPFGIMDWNSIFWIAQPGGPKILNGLETGLGLRPDKLRASRHVLSEYGNVSSPTVLLVLDEMRKSSAAEGRSTTGEGLDWGVLFGFGPGLTVETVVLRTHPCNYFLVLRFHTHLITTFSYGPKF